MAETIRVPDAYYAWLEAHNEEGETMFETLRRLTREPDPDTLAGIMPSDDVSEVRQAANRFGSRDEKRLERARETFEE